MGETVSGGEIIWNWGEIESFRQLHLFFKISGLKYTQNGFIISLAKRKIHNSKQYVLCFKSPLASESSNSLCDFDDQT